MTSPVPFNAAICPACERELFTPKDRRYLYPFIRCADCGPRVHTAANAPMCEACNTEYLNPADRRFHSQPINCPQCGPFVHLRDEVPGGSNMTLIDLRLPAILKARRLLREGRVLAVKGLDAFWLVCDAGNIEAVEALRRKKGEAGKPFTVMAADLSVAVQYCEIAEAERSLLRGREKPVLILKKRKHSNLPGDVAPGVDSLGLRLPNTPLFHLLLNQTDPMLMREPAPQVLAMSHAHLHGEPVISTNEDALDRLSSLADAFLLQS